MPTVTLHRPTLDELSFRQRLLADPATMAFNHAYGGTIDFPPEKWAGWYERWVLCENGERFYRYLRWEDVFVGEVAYHFDEQLAACLADVTVLDQYRGRGFGRQGLALLCAAAKEKGVVRLCDNIAVDNPSVRMFLKAGFRERSRNREYVLVEKEL